MGMCNKTFANEENGENKYSKQKKALQHAVLINAGEANVSRDESLPKEGIWQAWSTVIFAESMKASDSPSTSPQRAFQDPKFLIIVG